MSGENEKEWGVLGATERGASHVQANKPNQDAILWKQGDQAGLPLMLAISDGHGSEKYFRSDIGAQFAVKIALDEIDSMVRQVPFPVTNFTLVKQLFTEELPKGIVTRWQKEVEEHWDKNPPNKEERELLRKKENASILSNPVIPYGATLLAVLVTPSFILYLQLGDGDIIMLLESGQSIRLMQADSRLVANETTSLCSTTPATIKDDFRKQFHILQGAPPALIMLSTDGYSNSFTKEEGFLKAGFDIFKKLREDGVDAVNRSLPEWLTKTSEGGSGDDISLGLLFRMSALKKPGVFPLEPSANLAGNPDSPVDVTQRKESQGAAASSGEPIVASPLQNVAGEVGQGSGQEFASPVVAGNDLPGQPLNVHDEKTILAQPPAPAVKDVQRDEKQVTPAQSVSKAAPTLPAAAPPTEKHALIVSQTPGEGDYQSISDALKHAQSQTRIEVHPGTYRERESLVLTQDIELVATGPQNAVILSGQAPCLQIESEGAVIVGFRIQGKARVGGLLSRDKAAVDISAGHSRLTNCNITSETNVCVHVHGPMTAPKLTNCAIYHSAGKGIVFSGGAQGMLVDSQVFENRYVGVEIVDGSNPIIHHCQIRNGGDKGLFIWKKGDGRIERCEIAANQSTGIEISREGNPSIRGCQIYENKGTGIVVDDHGRGMVEDCTIWENAGRGIEIFRASTPTIKGCKLMRGKRSGIAFDEGGAGVVENCDISEQRSIGIVIQRGANPLIRHCKIHDGNSDGVVVEYQGGGTLDDCEIYGNTSYGIRVRLGSTVTILGGSIHHHTDEKYSALLISTAGSAKVDHCKIESPKNIGIYVRHQSKVVLRSCYIRCGSYCLVVSQESTAEVDKSSNLQSSLVSKPWVIEQGSHLFGNGSGNHP